MLMGIKNRERRKTICSIVRTYLIFKHKATTRELYDFINFSGFNLGNGVNSEELARIILTSIRKNGILGDVKTKKVNTTNIYILER